MTRLSASDLQSTASGELTATVGELELCYETFGSATAPPVLLIMGLASQMLLWDDQFCEQLAARGFRVIRFDNRDIGRSSHLRGAAIPTRWQLLRRSARGAAYTLEDMAADSVGLLDHLEIGAAHIVGASMGGMIAQLVAINHPERVLSLVSIMSTTGNPKVGKPQPKMMMRLMRKGQREREAYIEDHIETYRAIGSKTVRLRGGAQARARRPAVRSRRLPRRQRAPARRGGVGARPHRGARRASASPQP